MFKENALRNNLDSVEKLYQKQGFKMNFGLGSIEYLLNYAGNPQKYINFIHITGTNGKGSVSRIIYEIIKSHGLIAGIYTSPHLLRFNERIIVNDEQISDADLDGLKNYFLASGLKCSFFELTTAICFKYFKEKNVDIAVIEAGLGGMLDATNVIEKPLMSIITNISIDHSEILGNSYKKIALDKAGIIKKNSIMITGERKTAIREILINEAINKNALYFSTNLIKITHVKNIYNYYGLYSSFEDILFPSFASYHKYNLAIALLSIEILFKYYKDKINKNLSEESVRKGISYFKNEGRFEIIHVKDKTIVLDGAHNPDGIKNLIISLKNIYKNCNYIFIFGVMKDKDYKTMLRRLSKMDRVTYKADIIFTNVNNERSMDSKLLQEYSDNLKYFNNSYAVKNIKEAIDKAFRIYSNNNKNEIIVICGSLYLLGDFKKIN